MDLARTLERTHSKIFNFIFTLAPDKFDDLTKREQLSSVCNIGIINLQQCPFFYSQIDCVLLPSLLECFSITPYEAMLMKKVVFLSDREFFKSVCQDNAIYFDPNSVDSAIKTLVEWNFKREKYLKYNHLETAFKFVINKSHSKSKSISYFNLISNI
jgi:glycosyltransferase involved in cell wall biosynthesis